MVSAETSMVLATGSPTQMLPRMYVRSSRREAIQILPVMLFRVVFRKDSNR